MQAMGDPVDSSQGVHELRQRFSDYCASQGARCVFSL
jgi:lysylphosphatidylglycerol synthetase-like protein (DUF2156 family)